MSKSPCPNTGGQLIAKEAARAAAKEDHQNRLEGGLPVLPIFKRLNFTQMARDMVPVAPMPLP